MSVLSYFAVVALLIVVVGAVNEKWLHIQSDIVLILFSLGISVLVIILGQIPGASAVASALRGRNHFNFAAYLLDGVLCFMLFAGSSRVSVTKFRQNLRPIGLLALLGTVVSSAVYGLIFFAVSFVFHMNMDLWTCILLGCIVSPTDPIAATGILNKLGMSKNVTSVIECESLFNDGTGVASVSYTHRDRCRIVFVCKRNPLPAKGRKFFLYHGKRTVRCYFCCGCCIFSALLSSEAYRGSGQTYSDQPDGCDAGLCDMRAFGILGSDRSRRLRYVLCLHEKPGFQKADGAGS